jgi:hypothetical protein
MSGLPSSGESSADTVMTSDDIVRAVVEACSDLGIEFMVVGSLSSNYYGIARSTQDADFVVALKPGQLHALMARLNGPFSLDPQPSFECVTFTTKYVLRVAGLKYTVELFELSEDEYDQERFRRRVEVELYGRRGWLPTPEDVVVTKLQWYHADRRNKDIDDVVQVIAVQDGRLDWEYIERWCTRHGSLEHLEAARREAAEA